MSLFTQLVENLKGTYYYKVYRKWKFSLFPMFLSDTLIFFCPLEQFEINFLREFFLKNSASSICFFFCNFNYFCAIRIGPTFTVLMVELKEDGVVIISYVNLCCMLLPHNYYLPRIQPSTLKMLVQPRQHKNNEN
jgi:hypothetical protein